MGAYAAAMGGVDAVVFTAGIGENDSVIRKLDVYKRQVEYKTVSAGVEAADAMAKTADIDIVEASVVCPGKYIVLITGDLSAVKASVDRARVCLLYTSGRRCGGQLRRPSG